MALYQRNDLPAHFRYHTPGTFCPLEDQIVRLHVSTIRRDDQPPEVSLILQPHEGHTLSVEVTLSIADAFELIRVLKGLIGNWANDPG